MSNYHIPVLLQEVIEGLQIRKDAKYIDATLGGGGHTVEIVKRGGKVLGIDVDEDALGYVEKEIKDNKEVVLAKGNFKEIDRLAKEQGFEHVDGVLFDLGVSSFQLETAKKGFSFLRDGPLDMRMDTSLQVSAADLVNGLTRSELGELFWKLGEERNGKRIAKTIEIERQFKKIETTDDLVRVIEKAYGVTNEVLSIQRRAQISMRVFQALRIAVNDELHVLQDALPKAIGLLVSGARLVVITFHSLEDRIVKEKFIKFEKEGLGAIITKKPLIAKEKEALENRRSRSAKLRIFEKL
jgi:16S rRNA (cytosine1402-N4)-methyltransferase